jgi:hypothetical protein
MTLLSSETYGGMLNVVEFPPAKDWAPGTNDCPNHQRRGFSRLQGARLRSALNRPIDGLVRHLDNTDLRLADAARKRQTCPYIDGLQQGLNRPPVGIWGG